MRRLAAIVLLAATSTACFYGEPRVYTDQLRLVPNVVGEQVDIARVALEEEGLIVQVETSDRTPAEAGRCPTASVLAQDVPAGEGAVSGTIVTLTVEDC